MEDQTEPVQPDDGQGGEGGGSPYSSYLERVPEEAREAVEPIFKEWDGQVTKRFQESSEYRKQWEPYEQAGINQVPAEELQGWLQFRQAAMENPQAISEWYQQYAQQNGLLPEEQPAEPQFVDPDMEQMFEQRLGPVSQQLEEIRAWREQQEQQAQLQAANEFIEQQMSGLQEKHGDQFNREGVEKFIANHIESDPQNAVERAFADYQNMVASIEKQLVNSKLNQPSPAEAGGGTAAQQEQPRGLREAGELAKAQIAEMIRQNQ